MARPINSKVLFLTTSPRTPEKMIPEIELLVEHFTGDFWNVDTQCAFMNILRKALFGDVPIGSHNGIIEIRRAANIRYATYRLE